MLHRFSTKWVAPVFAALLIVGLVFTVNSVRSHAPASQANAAAPPSTTAAQITLQSSAWNLTFSEVSSITSKITPTTDAGTGPVHTKPLGDPQPPKVVLKRDLDPAGNQTLFAWHQMARQGLATARMDVTLTVDETGGTITYRLLNAWLSKLDTSGPVAGSKQPAVETATILCDEIDVQ